MPQIGSTAQPGVRASSVAYAATVTPNADTTDVLNVGTLTGDVTVANPLGAPVDGQSMRMRFAQDATGGRTTTWGSAYAFGSDVTAALIPTTVNAVYEMMFTWHAGSSKWRCVAILRGF